MPQYRVQVLETLAPWGFTRHMKVQRGDGKSGISWDDLQRLKDEHMGPDVPGSGSLSPVASCRG